jgi:hypothetical protein
MKAKKLILPIHAPQKYKLRRGWNKQAMTTFTTVYMKIHVKPIIVPCWKYEHTARDSAGKAGSAHTRKPHCHNSSRWEIDAQEPTV